MAHDKLAEIKVCRVCLAVDVKMYDIMKQFKLSEMFTNVTGIPVCDETEGTLHLVCWECAARLTAASAFRDKALFSDTLLKEIVHINKREIKKLKQYYNHLKSPLTVQTVFTSADIECRDIIPEEEFQSDETKMKTRRNSNISEEGTVFHEEEPLIGIPVKTEIESDPIAENIHVKDDKRETFSERTNFDDSFTSSKEDSDGEIRNTEKQINNNAKSEDVEMTNAPIKDEIDIVEDSAGKKQQLDAIDNIFDKSSSGDTEMNIEPNDDSDIRSAEDNAKKQPKLDVVENILAGSSIEDTEMNIEPNDDSDIGSAEDCTKKQPKLDVVENILAESSIEDTEMNIEPNDDSDNGSAENNVEENPMFDDINEPSSEEDTQSLAELVSVKKAKKRTSRKVGASNKRSNRLNDGDKQKIIALKEKGLSMPEIAEETGKTISCITAWWQRYSQEDSDIAEDTIEENEPEQNDTRKASNLVAVCPPSVRRKLREAGFEHLLRKYGDINKDQKVSKYRTKSDSLKQQIIALKQTGLTTSRTAQLLEITRGAVQRWWARWCNEGNLSERKRSGRERKTTAREDQLILDRVTQSESIHIASLAKEFGISPQGVRRRLKEAGFKQQFTGPYIPLKAGRTKKVDEDLKQRIMIMKQNGVSVTEMAKKFRVPRTTIYLWWRRWCKENNTETRDNDMNDTIEEEQASAEDAKNEEIEKKTKKLSTKKASRKKKPAAKLKS